MILRLLSALVVITALALPAAAQDRRVPASPLELRMSYAPVVQKAAPSVVNVYAARVVENRNPFMDDPFFRRFFGGGAGGMPREQVQRALGSGVIVDAAGLVMTNNHVIEGASEVKIALADKREFEAEIVLKDARTDLAVLRIKDGREKFTAIDLGNSDELQVGDVVLALGNPFGVGQTVTHGIVSALARTQVGITDYQFFIQTDAAINPGNSGGGLVDLAGRLVGLNTAIFSRSGGSQGIGFAIPVNMVKVVVASAKSGGTTVKRPCGALVATITERGPAARAGLKTGDLIVAIDGQSVDDQNAFDYRFATKPLGGTAQIGVVRGGKELKLSAALETAPEMPRDELVIRARSPFMGMKVANISPALAEELRLDVSAEGVAVLDIADGSLAQNLGFQKGDVIAAVNNEKIARTRDLERMAKESTRHWAITLVRGGQTVTVQFGG